MADQDQDHAREMKIEKGDIEVAARVAKEIEADTKRERKRKIDLETEMRKRRKDTKSIEALLRIQGHDGLNDKFNLEKYISRGWKK